jgi:hypothetical protein
MQKYIRKKTIQKSLTPTWCWSILPVLARHSIRLLMDSTWKIKKLSYKTLKDETQTNQTITNF